MRETIASLQNPRIKSVIRLRERRARQKQKLTVIDGIREIERALIAGVKITQAFILDERQKELSELANNLMLSGADIVMVNGRVFEKLAFGNRSEGIVVTATPPELAIDDMPTSPDAIIGVIESVEKPGNIGAIIRSADAAGVAGVIIANAGTDLYNPNAIRSSLGTIFKMPLCSTTSDSARQWLTATDTNIFVARVDGATNYTETDLTGRIAIVLGSESEGVSQTWRDADLPAIKLPMHGISDSLNVSVTAAVLFYEALRQRSC